MRLKLLVVVFGAALAFGLGYGAMAQAFPSGGVHGRAEYRGYFTNAGPDSSGWEVLNKYCSGSYYYANDDDNCNAIPSTINTAAEFISFIQDRLTNGAPGGTYGDDRARTGAAFIVHTMLGTPAGSRARPPTATQMTNWRALVNAYGSAGRINWNTSSWARTGLNSYYQGTDNTPSPNDDAFYDDTSSGAAIVFNTISGPDYIIRLECANPVGAASLPALSDFNMFGSTAINANPTPLPGENVVFRHTLTNTGPTSSSSITWTGRDSSTGTPGNVTITGSAGTFTNGQSKTFDETVTVPAGAAAGSTICRRAAWTPDTEAGGTDYGAPVCATVRYSYTLVPSITVQVNGAVSAGNIAEQGDAISFSYAVNNSGITQSQTVTCTYRQASYTGYSTAAPSTTFTPAGSSCAPSRVFPAATNTVVATEASVAASPGNTSICRSFTITPTSQSGGTQTVQACAFVTTKPYTRVYGGDIVAGGGIETAPGVCSSNPTAAVIGWNKRDVGGAAWAGAGAQYAIYAMNRIYDVAAGLGNPAASASTAPAPHGLSFANTATNTANGNFGGDFGSVPCIPDHYGTRPAAAASVPGGTTIASLVSGTYAIDGNAYFSGAGNINPGERITLYVDGDVYLNTPAIDYVGSGSWSAATIPSFRLIVRGNIYIDFNTTRLDGLYVAQPRSDGTKGIIYTCASTVPALYTPLSLTGSLGSQCDNKLTVNGAFVAKQVQLLRTLGTMRASTAGEASSSSNIAEVFNYTPMLWISQPTATSGTADYDAINSLPPVL